AAMTRLAAETVSKMPACARKAGIQPDTIPIPKTKSTSNAGTIRLVLRISGCLQRQPENPAGRIWVSGFPMGFQAADGLRGAGSMTNIVIFCRWAFWSRHKKKAQTEV
ncbi:hypothetical protein, partial [Kingella pumchi]